MAGLGIAGNNGMSMGRTDMSGNNPKVMLNTYIYNYLISEGQREAAKSLLDSRLPMDHDKIKKETKNQVNGIDANGDADTKDENKNRASTNDMAENALLEYWLIFWDMWTASKYKEPTVDTNGGQYLNRSRQMMPQHMLQNMPVNNYGGAFRAGGAGMNGLRQQVGMQQTMNGQIRRNGMGQNPMQRDGSGMDMNGEQRPHSPSSGGENAPSPKRQRVDGGYGAPQMGGLQRNSLGSQLPNGSIGNTQAMMMQQKGMDPSRLQYSEGMKQQAQTAMSNLGNHVNNFQYNGNNDSPMMADGQFDMSMMNNQQMRNSVNGSGNGANNGNGGALADYQMQLMLLEQQNKKRLMMARQEQEPSMGQPGYGPGNSPPHGRNGQSPNGGDLKRPSPNLGQGSPPPEGSMPPHLRNSPIPGGYDPTQMTNGMGPQFANQMNSMGPGGQMMRGPNSHPMNGAQMEMMRRNGQMPNEAWNGGPMPGQMMPQGPGGQTQADNQQQRNNMPPPSAPPSGSKAQSSPTPQNAAPPTPSQKKEAKSKKETEKTKKKAPKKTQSTTSATPNPENDKQSTPPPSTPVIPVHPEAATIKGQNNNQDQSQAGQQNQPQGVVQQNNVQAQPGSMQQLPDNVAFGNFEADNGLGFGDFPDFSGNMGGQDNGMNDILEAFDFDTFINDGAVGGSWDGADFGLNDGLDTGP